MWHPLPKTPLRWAGVERTFHKIYNPNNRSVIGEVEFISSKDIELITAMIIKGQIQLNTIPACERARWLKEIAHKIRLKSIDLAKLIALEGGKPLKDAKVEVTRAATTFELCAEEIKNISTDGPTLPFERLLIREPIGPVLALSAFNHPLNLLAHQVGSALAAGCAVVFKPSPSTPYCAEWLADTLKEIGVPQEIAILCHADVSEIEALVAREEFQFVSFIGSAKIGWSLRQKIAAGTRLALEHGGVATAIVHKDANIDKTVSSLVRGAFYHAGQVCISTQRIFVEKSIADDFKNRFIAATQKLITGDAREEETDVGPLIRPEVKSKLQEWISEAQSLGAKILLQDKESSEHFMSPVILENVAGKATLFNEEAFGPIVFINTFTHVSEVYEIIQNSPYHFASALFSENIQSIMDGVKKIACMNLMINEHTSWRVDAMPFGGHRKSGLGMGGVKWAIEEQTRLKQVVFNTPSL
jgi:acyl-CoA reductase-like NAD-dependent aldehyde dehydrogenase